MSTHYHVVLHVNTDIAQSLSNDQVIERWLKLYKGTELVQRYAAGEVLTKPELVQLKSAINQWRDNLTNISRFMANLNEYIARKAYKEDDCKGTFWESRFELQAVLDVPALLQTMCYVDLNPVRAKMAKTPEESKYTSIRRRLHKRRIRSMNFCTNQSSNPQSDLKSLQHLPISFKQYLSLLIGLAASSQGETRIYRPECAIDQVTPGVYSGEMDENINPSSILETESAGQC